MKRGYPIFTWKHRIIDSGLNVTGDIDEYTDIEELQIQDVPDNNENEMNEGDMHQHIVVDDAIGVDDGEENYDLGNDEDTNYVTDELSTNGDINGDENKEDEFEDEEVMGKDVANIDTVEQNIESDVETDEVIVDEIFGEDEDEGIEVNLNASGRPRRKCVGKGVERFSFMNVAANYLFTQTTDHAQMSTKAGIKKIDAKAITAMLNKYKQLNIGPVPGKPIFGCINPSKITNDEKRRALEAVNLIKKKRCGKIKGRTCADGSKQKRFLKHGESISSPTVSLEAIVGTLLIDVHKDRDVAIFDVPGAYLQAEMPKEKKLLMKFRDEFVNIMCEVNPEYKKYVVKVNGKEVLYVKILRAIYG